MTILNVSNLAMDFGGVVTDTTDLDERDPAYSPTGVTMQNGATSVLGWDDVAVSDDTWVHFRVRTDALFNANADGYWLTFQNEAGQDLARVDLTNAAVYAVVYGDSTVNGTSALLAGSTTYTIDLRLSTAGGNLTFEVYSGGGASPITSATVANTGGKLGPVHVMFNNNDISGGSTAIWHYSEFIVTDGEDTRGWRLATLEPNTNGNYNDWNGDVNELGDTDQATSVQSDTTGERQSWNPTAYGGPASPSSIRAVVAKSNSARGITGSPSQITQFLRIASTDYDGAAQVFSTGEQKSVLEIWGDNPDTGLPWDTADLATIEVGLLSTT